MYILLRTGVSVWHTTDAGPAKSWGPLLGCYLPAVSSICSNKASLYSVIKPSKLHKHIFLSSLHNSSKRHDHKAQRSSI